MGSGYRVPAGTTCGKHAQGVGSCSSNRSRTQPTPHWPLSVRHHLLHSARGPQGSEPFQSHQIASGSSHSHQVAGASSSSLEYWTRTATCAAQFYRWIASTAPQTQSSHHGGQPVATQAEHVQVRTSIRRQCGWNAVLGAQDAPRAGLRYRNGLYPGAKGIGTTAAWVLALRPPQINFYPQV